MRSERRNKLPASYVVSHRLGTRAGLIPYEGATPPKYSFDEHFTQLSWEEAVRVAKADAEHLDEGRAAWVIPSLLIGARHWVSKLWRGTNPPSPTPGLLARFGRREPPDLTPSLDGCTRDEVQRQWDLAVSYFGTGVIQEPPPVGKLRLAGGFFGPEEAFIQATGRPAPWEPSPQSVPPPSEDRLTTPEPPEPAPWEPLPESVHLAQSQPSTPAFPWLEREPVTPAPPADVEPAVPAFPWLEREPVTPAPPADFGPGPQTPPASWEHEPVTPAPPGDDVEPATPAFSWLDREPVTTAPDADFEPGPRSTPAPWEREPVTLAPDADFEPGPQSTPAPWEREPVTQAPGADFEDREPPEPPPFFPDRG